MARKPILLSLFTFILFVYAEAQNTAINWLNGDKVTNGSVPLKLAEKDSNGFCILNQKKIGFFKTTIPPPILERFTYPDCKRVYSIDLDKDAKGKEVDLDYVTVLGLKNNMVILRKDDKHVYAQQINRETGEIADTKVTVGDLPDKLYQRLPSASGLYAVSGDGSTFVVSYIDTTAKKITAAAFGEDLQQKWTRVIDKPFQDNWYYPIDLRVSYDGNTAYWASLQYFDNFLSKNTHEFAFNIIAYYHSNNTVSTYDMNLEDKWVSSFTINLDNQGDLICAGFYSVFKPVDDGFEVKTALLGAIPVTQSSSAGSFIMRLNHATKQITQCKTSPFDKDFLLKHMDENQAASGSQIKFLMADSIITMPDKSVVMFGEQRSGDEELYSTLHYDPNVNHFNSSPSFNNGRPGQTYVSYNRQISFDFDDAVIVKFNPDGSVALLKNIAKLQFTDIYSRHCSFAPFVKDNSVYMAYNDNIKNLELPADIVSKEDDDNIKKAHLNYGELGARNVLVLAKIDLATGTIERTCLTDKKDSYKMLFTPALAVQYKPDSFIMFHENDETYEFGEVKLLP